jgi:hypothetical protein
MYWSAALSLRGPELPAVTVSSMPVERLARVADDLLRLRIPGGHDVESAR